MLGRRVAASSVPGPSTPSRGMTGLGFRGSGFRVQGPTVGAFMIRIGFWYPLWYSFQHGTLRPKE